MKRGRIARKGQLYPKVKTVPMAGCPKTVPAFSRFSRNLSLSLQSTQMRKVLAALMEVTGIRKFFTGVTVELPAYFLPNFRVVEMHDAKRARVRPLTGR
jgi:hypothetical protein